MHGTDCKTQSMRVFSFVGISFPAAFNVAKMPVRPDLQVCGPRPQGSSLIPKITFCLITGNQCFQFIGDKAYKI